MKSILKFSLSVLIILLFLGCKQEPKSLNSEQENRKKIEMVTNYGTMIIELYNETPLHRDNFTNLVNNNAYDSLLFHRVINEFMIQGGDPDSRKAQPNDELGNGPVPYVVNAEFNKDLFHKKGALAAARDGNPKRASSGMQFYIVQGKVSNDSLLTIAETRINGWLAEYYFKKDPINKPLVNSLEKAMENENSKQYTLLNDSITKMAKDYGNFERYTIPESHRQAYKTIGGTPHLDQNYTVFGEVIKGLEVLDSIASVPTVTSDRPAVDVRIHSVRSLQ
jgi:cyclophilin family peptidyl-prolyl cis-trans isomerase